MGGLLALAIVFVAGLLLGHSGLLRSPGTGLAPTISPLPTLAPASALPGTADPTTPEPATDEPSLEPTTAPSPTQRLETPVPVVTPDPGPTPTQPPDAPADFGLFWEALEIIRQQFVGRDELEDRQLTYGAIDGLVEALGDTGHTVFLTPEQLQRERESLSGTIVGVGALLGERAGRPIIVSVISGGPAQRAGLRSGDAFVTVDGESVVDLEPAEIATRVRGEAGTTVEIVVDRPASGERLTFSIVREEIRIPAAGWAMVPGTDIAVLRLIQFSDGAGDALQEVRDQAVAAGAGSFILDLRSNPGGIVHEAVHTASLFLDEGNVYIREQADGSRIPEPVDQNVPSSDLPMVVLIDEGTASSAEIVSGALRSAGRAELVGATTFGTGTVLLTYELSDGSAVRLAVERWLTPDGELIFGQGITPTQEVELAATDRPVEPDELRDLAPEDIPNLPDPQLLRAIELLGS
ncbi:MAG TPA: S41 family peptidase [Candidatus Limnocylindria bacterium]|nr:S41 family peptidase [Candidatus Limnocylindria bacterium]